MKIKKLLLLSILSLSLVSCANTNDVNINTANTETSDMVVTTTEKNFMADEYDPWEIGRASCRERVYVLV